MQIIIFAQNKKMMSAPIIIFAYNRPQHTEKVIKSLLLNKEAKDSDLIVYCDGAKNEEDTAKVAEVRNLVNKITGFKKITSVFRDKNIGLAKNIIDGVTKVFETYDTAIVLEDDLVVTPLFLKYMNSALKFYEKSDVQSVSGYTPPVTIPDNYNFTTYSIMRNCSWGWATWKDRWMNTDWEVKDFKDFISNSKLRKEFNQSGSDLCTMLLKQQTGVINSWSIRFCYSGYKKKLKTIYPVLSLVVNNGADGSGTNIKSTSKYQSDLFLDDELTNFNFVSDTTVNPIILKSFRKTYNCSIVRRIINYCKLKKYLNSHQ